MVSKGISRTPITPVAPAMKIRTGRQLRTTDGGAGWDAVHQKSDGELPPCPFGIIEILFTEH